ncbi:PAS domain S-box-containing protein [Sphingomonas sp. NFR04]|uniref:response regulator n=1 Tax=Sphingomonas sp. NFR04 TaxID=1566283 RepID=UPI0008DFF4AB|nr:response regulator [Sphingomonas sp. NFR04]SFK51241.1 PAS domain S-box-containing protein [Sphingomonas sp. NFR04]
MKHSTLSERALVLAPRGRDATIAAAMLREGGIEATACASLLALITELDAGAAFVLVTEEAITSADLNPLAEWLSHQEEWSDMPFVLLTTRGGGLERNPAAVRYLEVLGNVTFLERPFHPTTLISLARSALRARKRQYEARARLTELREGEARYRTLFDTMDEGFAVIEFLDGPEGPLSDYIHVQANPAYARHTGIANVIGQRVREMVPDEADGWVALYRQVLVSGEPVRFERELVATRRQLELSAFRIEPSSRKAVAVIFQDVTERKRAEQELRELNEGLEARVTATVAERETVIAQLHEAQKLETIGQLTGGVAHDINNLLTPITGALDLLNRRYGADDPRSARLLDGALQSAERAKILVSRLLGFARRQALETRAVDIAQLFEGMRDLIASSIGPAIELRMLPVHDLPAGVADPNQLELAILNLCVNARDAMEGGGVLTIAADRIVLGPGTPSKLNPGAYIRISVIDTGAGMDEVTLAKAVEPFFSTKDVGKGTGLGLSMVHGLAAQLGGAFELQSSVGQGTRADLYLPVATGGAIPSTARLPAAGKPVRPLRLLLIDDEELVRRGTAEMLRELGHEVHEAAGGAQALAKLRTGIQIDAVVSDYMMPRMNGTEVAERIREGHPDMPILIVTGYAGGDLDLPLPQLAKPFRQIDIAMAIDQLIATP